MLLKPGYKHVIPPIRVRVRVRVRVRDPRVRSSMKQYDTSQVV